MLGQFVDNFDTRQISRQRLALATAFGRRNDFLVANRIVGLDSAFSWGGMAASALAANVSGQIVQPGVGGMVVRGQVAAHANAFMNDKWFGGDKPDYSRVAADAFGNVLANFAFGAADSFRTQAARYGTMAASLADGLVVDLPASRVTPDQQEPLFDFDAGQPGRSAVLACRTRGFQCGAGHARQYGDHGRAGDRCAAS